MTIEKFLPENGKNRAFFALEKMMKDRDAGVSYADMIRYRAAGKAKEECFDTYYVAYEGDTPLSRLWMGFGKHPFSIGNWGNFFTAEAARGKGVGRAMLDFWKKDLEEREALPLALFCSAATEALTSLYARYGWRCAAEGEKKGHLYLPLGDSPPTFAEFCEKYYTPTDRLIRKKACVGYRHEIDLLLKFALKREGLLFGFEGAKSLEEILLSSPNRSTLLFTEEGKCVGWSLDGKDQIYPKYKNLPVVEEEKERRKRC